MSKARKKNTSTPTVSGSTTAELDPIQAGGPLTGDAETRQSALGAQDTGDTTVANVDRQRVASRAYELYIQRGGQHGRALDDWLEAEQELLESTRRNRDRE